MVHRTGVRLARVTEKEIARTLINCAIVMLRTDKKGELLHFYCIDICVLLSSGLVNFPF